MGRRKRRHGSSRLVIAAIMAAAMILAIAVVVNNIRMKPPVSARPIEIVSSDWPPYMSDDLENQGPLAEIITAVLGSSGYSPEFRFTTWPLAESAVESGSSIAMAPVILTDSRERFGNHSDAILDFEYRLFGLHGPHLETIASREDLTGIRVARIAGYQLWEPLEQSGATFLEYPTAQAAFIAVAEGQADVVVEGSIAGQAVLKSPDVPFDASDFDVVALGAPFASSKQSLHLLVRDDLPGRSFLAAFNAQLAEYRKTDEYSTLVSSIGALPSHVRLVSADGGSVDLCASDGAVTSVTPARTSADVVSWPDDAAHPDALAKVKLLDGPSRGEVVFVRLDDMEMADDG